MTIRSRTTIAGLTFVLGLTAAACSGGSPNAAVVQIKGFQFKPGTITVRAGGTVTWKNGDDVAHTVTAGTAAAPTGYFDSGNKVKGESFSQTFSSAGTFAYFCNNHGGMHGVVKVT